MAKDSSPLGNNTTTFHNFDAKSVNTITIAITNASSLNQKELTAPDGCLVLVPDSGGFIPWDNPDNIISQEAEKAVDRAVNEVCLPILFLISVPCNILNMLVFWKQGLKERINLCLFFLSLVDFLHILNSFFYNVDKLHLRLNKAETNSPVLEFILNHKLSGLRGFIWISGFTSVFIACERCLCVVSPLRSQTVLKTQTTAIILTSASVLILTGSMVIGVRWNLSCVLDPTTNTTSKAIYTGEFYTRNKAYLDILSFFVLTLQPCTYVSVVFALTIVTSVKLKKMVAWRAQASSSAMSAREMALTRTLIAVSILYIVCSFPSMMCGLIVIFVPDMSLSGRYYNMANVVVSLFELASFINATFNFFVYCFLGSKYRETLRAVIQCGCSVAGPTTNLQTKGKA